MRKQLLRLLSLALFIILLGACTSAREKYYETPDWLEGTLYEQIEAEGGYSEYLKCLDITGYADIFGRGGSYTLFVPTDEAFEEFYLENGYASASDVPVDELTEIIEGLTLNYAYSKERLIEWSSFEYSWRNDARAFRKRTILRRLKREGDESILVSYDYKYIPLFTEEYFAYRNSTITGVAYDQTCYEYFFPGVSWTGLNLADAHLITDDIAAENGFFFGIDKVVRPLDNITEVIESEDNYSLFNSLCEKFVQYTADATLTSELMNNEEQVYTRDYDLNGDFNEDEMMTSDHSTFNMFALAVPVNNALQSYIDDDVLSMGYSTMDEVPDLVWQYLVNNHIKVAGANASYYPQDLLTETSQWAEIDYWDSTQVCSSQFASNGPIYGLNFVLEPDAINSVARTIFFDPDYSLFLYAAEIAGSLSTIGDDEYTVLAFKNDVFSESGYTYSSLTNSFYLDGVAVESSDMTTLIGNQIYIGSCDASHAVGNFAKNINGVYAKFSGGTVSGSDSSVVLYDALEERNGFFYNVDQMVESFTLDALTTVITNEAYSALLALMTSASYTVSTIASEVTSNENILFVPTNEAIAQAQADGLLPYTDTTLTDEQISTVKKFIKNLIVPTDLYFTTSTFVAKSYNTMYGESISLSNTDGEHITIVKDNITAQTTDVTSDINNLATGGWVVHSIDKVLID